MSSTTAEQGGLCSTGCGNVAEDIFGLGKPANGLCRECYRKQMMKREISFEMEAEVDRQHDQRTQELLSEWSNDYSKGSRYGGSNGERYCNYLSAGCEPCALTFTLSYNFTVWCPPSETTPHCPHWLVHPLMSRFVLDHGGPSVCDIACCPCNVLCCLAAIPLLPLWWPVYASCLHYNEAYRERWHTRLGTQQMQGVLQGDKPNYVRSSLPGEYGSTAHIERQTVGQAPGQCAAT